MKTAGMTYTYAKACVAGKLADCECMALNQDHPEALPQEIWSWAGCLESLIQARREVYHFVYSWADPGQTPKRRFMDVHNEVVGTQVGQFQFVHPSFKQEATYCRFSTILSPVNLSVANAMGSVVPVQFGPVGLAYQRDSARLPKS